MKIPTNYTMTGETLLFDQSILDRIDYSKSTVEPRDKLTEARQRDDIRIRPLAEGDYSKGFPNILSQLTVVGDVSEEDFLKRFHRMKSCVDSYFIVVIEDTVKNKVIGSGTLAVEHKLNSKLQLISQGRIEDIVVDKTCRGMQLGKLILETLTMLAKEICCTVCSLECKDSLVRFYSQFGLEPVKDERYMTIRYFK